MKTSRDDQFLRYANRGLGRAEFLRRVSRILLAQPGCDALELRLSGPDVQYRWEASARPRRSFRFLGPAAEPPRREDGKPYRSRLSIRFRRDGATAGVLQLKSLHETYFTPRRVEGYRRLAKVLGVALATRRAQWALRERVKELTCLYRVSQVAQDSGASLDAKLRRIAATLPAAWQFPGIACARIVLDGREYASPGFRDGPHRQTARIEAGGTLRGAVDVVYTRDEADFALGVFLKEEQSLIDSVARELALLIDRREAEDYRTELREQLRHADRLATIGQLAASVAHELNQPLGSILGFAQLAAKTPRLPKGAAADIDKIVQASLHAREVIQKLSMFAREMPAAKRKVDLNQIVRDSLFFFESRSMKAGVELRIVPGPDLPSVAADATQLHQVLINLVVNAIQAMPSGGTLTIATGADAEADAVWLRVEDTGVGMTPEVREKIFTPFFTTKDVDQGTGLGLSVVHGIVSAHGGSVHVESEPGRGSSFRIVLPAAKAGAHA